MTESSLLERLRASGAVVGVAGLGRHGSALARLLLTADVRVRIFERRKRDECCRHQTAAREIAELERGGASCVFGVDGEAVAAHLSDLALCILSPGVTFESAICGTLKRHGVPLRGELGFMLEATPGISVVVLGSHGKSTTGHLIAELLRGIGRKVRVAGLSGHPLAEGIIPRFSSEARGGSGQQPVTIYCCSLLQIEGMGDSAPSVLVLLNLHENILERFGNLERARRAVIATGARQGRTDLFVFNGAQSEGRVVAEQLQARVVDLQHVALAALPIERYALPGSHNRDNLAAAVAVARHLGMNDLQIADTIPALRTLPHRLELCETGDIHAAEGKRDVRFINDSKATSVAAVQAGVRAVLEGQGGLVLILGGRAGAASWGPLCETLQGVSARLRAVICYGADRGLIAHHLKVASLAHTVVPLLSDAVAAARRAAQPGDTVLFSPGCLSIDDFADFEARGNVFKSLC